jgi:hypothetical protein
VSDSPCPRSPSQPTMATTATTAMMTTTIIGGVPMTTAVP